MLNFFNYYWSKPKEGDEVNTDLPTKLLLEMKQYHYDNDTTSFAERKYDYDEVFLKLTNLMDMVHKAYEGCTYFGGVPVFYPGQKEKVKKAVEAYLDAAVQNKQFIFDHSILKLSLARRIIHIYNEEGVTFDWHYWQLFHRKLNEDAMNEDDALANIQKITKPFLMGDETNDEDDDDSFSSE
jgi:hypothetical protein